MKTPKYIDINYFTDKKAEEIKNKGGIILLGRIYDYKDGKLIKRKNNMKKDWKFWVMTICLVMCSIIHIIQKDWSCLIWIINVALWYYVGGWIISQYEGLTECQDSLLRDYCRIIELQSNRIKELENGKGREDSSDSGAGVVAEEALQAHEE